MTTYIGLLRGINVGGRAIVKMADLRQWLEEMGLEDVRTLLQSGNFVFRAKPEARDEIEARLEKELESRTGRKILVYIRTLKEWDAAIKANPFSEEAEKDPSHLLLHTLKEAPTKKEFETVQEAVKGPETMRLHDEILYVYFPDGIGTSKIDRTPGWNKMTAKATGRNWNTAFKLSELAHQLAD